MYMCFENLIIFNEVYVLYIVNFVGDTNTTSPDELEYIHDLGKLTTLYILQKYIPF